MATQRNLQPFEFDERGQPKFQKGLELGDLGFQSQLIKFLTDNPQFAELFAKSQGPRDPRVETQLGNLEGLRGDILGGGFFGGEEEQSFRDLISGKTLSSQSGALRSLIEEQFAGSRGKARDISSSLGLAPASGAAQSLTGNVRGAQDRALTEQMVSQFLNMVGAGTTGLGQMGGEQLARQQTAGGLSQFISQFIEGSDLSRLGIGADIASRQQQPFLDLLAMSQGQRANRGPTGFETALEFAGTALPFFLGPAGPAVGAASAATRGKGGSFGPGPNVGSNF